jgi:hypothetical protein
LPNELAAFCAVIIKGLARPLPGDEDATAGDAEMFDLVSFAFAPPGCHGMSGSLGLDAVKQPYRTPRRARSDAEFGVEPVNVSSLGVGGVITEPGCLADGFGQVNRQSLNAPSACVLKCLDGISLFGCGAGHLSNVGAAHLRG